MDTASLWLITAVVGVANIYVGRAIAVWGLPRGEVIGRGMRVKIKR